MRNVLKTLMLITGLLQGGTAIATEVIFLSPHEVNPYTVDVKGTASCEDFGTATIICDVGDISHFSATVTRTKDQRTCSYVGSLSSTHQPTVKLTGGTCAFNKQIKDTSPNSIKVVLQ